MRVLIINTDYPDFLRWLYAQHPGLERRSYAEQLRLRHESLYGVADFYSSNLRILGHEAQDVYANNEHLQRAWAAEHGEGRASASAASEPVASMLKRVNVIGRKTPARRLASYARAFFTRRRTFPRWSSDILKAQVQTIRPDVVLNQAVDCVPGTLIREIKPFARLVVGQHAATPLAADEDYGGYDLMISSFPPTVQWFKERGMSAFLSRLGFDVRVLSYLKPPETKFDLTFVGNFFPVHSSRQVWLEGVCRRFPDLKIWAPNREQLASASPLYDHYVEQAWGREMYHVLHASKITLNHHGNVAPYANNMRLFEATGVGAFLLTDWKQNLGDMFDVGKELVAYRSSEECAELIDYYLAHDKEREAIARAGQARTLAEHTYLHRMQEFMRLLEQHV